MANASPSSASTTTTPTPTSAWSRLVHITRTASEGSRRSNESSSQLNQILSPGTYTSSSAPPAKKRRLAESPPARSVTKYLAPLFPEPNDLGSMTPAKSTKEITCPPSRNHDCITACPCRVENVGCVASQEQGEHTRRCIPRSGPKLPISEAENPNQDVTLQSPRKDSRRGSLQRVQDSSPRHDGTETRKVERRQRLEELPAADDLVEEAKTAEELASPASCGSASLKGDDTVAKIGLETGQPAKEPSPSPTRPGLHEGDQNSVNKTPVPKRHSPSPASTVESIQLATPLSPPAAKPDTRADETQVDAINPHQSAAAHKTKRRLTLHGGSYERQSSHKRHKTAPKKKDGVQTTLSLAIGSSAGVRECKLCDTVYNPFHPEDVKVHTKRHAIAVKRERKSDEVSGLAGSPLVD